MQRRHFLLVIGFCWICGAFPVYAAPGPGTYVIDPSHSKVAFEIGHLVISSVEGRFREFSGTLVIGPKVPELKVLVVAASINTEEPKRDKHLRSPDFFDVEQFPHIAFESQKITGDINKKFQVHGNLSIRGVTRPVVLDAVYLGQAKDPWGVMRYAYKAKTQINRKDYGLVWNKIVEVGPLVGDEAELSLQVEMIQK